MLSTTAELVGSAHAAATGIAAFNVITLEHAEAVARAAEATGRAAILQISQNAVRYHGDLAPLAAACATVAASSPARLALHVDHVDDPALLHRAVECGASSAMFDGSRLPDRQNVAATRSAASWAHSNGLWLEAELGEIGGKGSAHTPGVRTDPAQAASFVEETGVDALAVAVGSTHAMVRQTAELDLDLISRLRDAVGVPLVLHGSSGIARTMLSDAVRAGMVKINIGTLLNVAFTDALRHSLDEDLAVVDPRRYLDPARGAMTEVVASCLVAISAD